MHAHTHALTQLIYTSAKPEPFGVGGREPGGKGPDITIRAVSGLSLQQLPINYLYYAEVQMNMLLPPSKSPL